jgi:general secretion pathway protein B
MSYILDALKKADAERERRGVPGLHAQAAGLAGEERRAGGVLRWVAVAGALLFVAALAWWWFGARGDAPAASALPPPATPVAAPPTPVVRAPVVQPPVLQAPAAQEPPATAAAPPIVIVPKAPPAPIAVPAPTPTPTPAAASAARSERVATLAELSPELRRQLPPLTVSGAMYAPQPSARLVFINGQVFREGDALNDGLVLERIGPTSSVLSLRGTRFELKH